MKAFFKKSYKNFIFRLSARNSFIFRIFYRYLFFPKKGSLAYFYDQLSKRSESIYTIQVGANDGINHDPIHKFIKRDHWEGLLLEPQTYVFRNKLFPLYQRDKGIMMENVALGTEIGLMEMYRLSFTNDRWATGLATFDRQTLEKKIVRGDIDALAKKNGVKLPKRKEDYIESFKVETKPFDFLMEKYNISNVDVLQIDAEGYDFEIVKMFDLTENKANVVVFEHSHIVEEEYKKVLEYFDKNDYEVKSYNADTIAVYKDFALGMTLLKAL